MRKSANGQRAGIARPLLRSPISERPEVHQITLPLPASFGGPHSSFDRVHVYLIERHPITLIDTGVRSVESRAVLEAALEELGLGLAEIERVVVTHAHRDHLGLVQSIREAGADLECCVHHADAETVERYPEVIAERMVETLSLFREYGVPEAKLEQIEESRSRELSAYVSEADATSVDRRLRGGDRISFKDHSLLVHHSPGHTPGHLLLEDEEAGLLFTGDQVMGQAIPNSENFYTGLLPEPGDRLGRRPRFKGLLEMRRGLRLLRQRSFRCLLPGFGGIIQRPERTIRDTLLFYDVRVQRIERGLKHLAAIGQDVTAYEIWRSLFPDDEPIGEMRTHLINLIGALDCLEADGHLRVARRSDGVLTHSYR